MSLLKFEIVDRIIDMSVQWLRHSCLMVSSHENTVLKLALVRNLPVLSNRRRRYALQRDSLSIRCEIPKMDDTERFENACQHFDRGEYFEAHEDWEELWHLASGQRHAYLQGLIQIAVALHHAQNRNYRGTRKLFARALEYLEKAGADTFEIDLICLKNAVLVFEQALQEIEQGLYSELPFFALPRN